MKKVLTLGAVAVVLGLSSLGAPAMAVSMGESSVVSAADAVSVAIARAEEALAVTADSTSVAGVASMRAYLQKWVAQARTVDASRLTTAQLEELVAALNEGARGLRATAGVDRKVTAGVDNTMDSAAGSVGSSAAATTSPSSTTVSATVAEPRIVKELPASVASTDSDVSASVSGATAAVAATADSTSTEAKGEVATLANAGVAQVKKPVVAATDKVASAKEVAELSDSEVEVPKTGMDEEEEKASSAVRGIGMILGGAVVLAAAAGAVLIVKRMKRGM